MNDIGWLFPFMTDFANNLGPQTPKLQPESPGGTAETVGSFATLTVEQMERVRKFFDLIAKWEEAIK